VITASDHLRDTAPADEPSSPAPLPIGAYADSCDTPFVSIVGYARVSTSHQSLDQQRDALAAAGCERLFSDKLSGSREDRPGMAEMLGYVRPGDTVVVIALDRVGRSLSAVIRTVEKLTEAGVLLRSLHEGIDYSTSTGRMLAGIFAALAGYERELMHERAAAARRRGRHTGRPRKLTQAQARQVRALRGAGESISELVDSYGVSRATIYRAPRDSDRAAVHA
jgi:DNA invertase Pin-like site-specific DNA recombinase